MFISTIYITFYNAILPHFSLLELLKTTLIWEEFLKQTNITRLNYNSTLTRFSIKYCKYGFFPGCWTTDSVCIGHRLYWKNRRAVLPLDIVLMLTQQCPTPWSSGNQWPTSNHVGTLALCSVYSETQDSCWLPTFLNFTKEEGNLFLFSSSNPNRIYWSFQKFPFISICHSNISLTHPHICYHFSALSSHVSFLSPSFHKTKPHL